MRAMNRSISPRAPSRFPVDALNAIAAEAAIRARCSPPSARTFDMTATPIVKALSFRVKGPNNFFFVPFLRDVRPCNEESLFDSHFRQSVLS